MSSNIDQLAAQAIRQSLSDIATEVGHEFKENFRRQAFFSQAWPRRKAKIREGSLLIDTGTLRNSIIAQVQGDNVVFTSSEPYAQIHNDGGTIVVTTRMKRYFWAKFNQENHGWSKSGSDLSTKAEFYKAMAMKRVGSKITIPKRQFIGWSDEVQQLVMQIVRTNLGNYLNNVQITFD